MWVTKKQNDNSCVYPYFDQIMANSIIYLFFLFLFFPFRIQIVRIIFRGALMLIYFNTFQK